mgnify:CR=1 FL=1
MVRWCACWHSPNRLMSSNGMQKRKVEDMNVIRMGVNLVRVLVILAVMIMMRSSRSKGLLNFPLHDIYKLNC